MKREPANQNQSALSVALGELRTAALNLAQAIELEESGIRDGNGFWHGSDGLGGSVDHVMRLGDVVRTLHAQRPDRVPTFASRSKDLEAPLCGGSAFARDLDDEIPF